MSVRGDAAGDYLSANANLPTNGGYTVFKWLKFINAGAGTKRVIWYYEDSGFSAPHYLRFDTDNVLRYTGDGASTTATLTSPTLTSWFAVAFVSSGTAAGGTRAYVRQEGAGAWTVGSDIAGSTFTANSIRVFSDSADYCDAEWRYLRMWNAALSEAELNAEFASLVPVRTSNLLRDVRLAAAASAGTDSSGNGYNMTANGTLADGASEPAIQPATSAGALAGSSARALTKGSLA